jgi:hypothetical protein
MVRVSQVQFAMNHHAKDSACKMWRKEWKGKEESVSVGFEKKQENLLNRLLHLHGLKLSELWFMIFEL